MAIDFTNILITVSDLRDRIGGPTTNPNSATYVTDAMLTEVIELKRDVAEEIVERQMERLSDEDILQMDVKFDAVTIAVSSGSNVASGTIPTANLPVIFKAHLSDGTQLDFDDDIHATANIYAGTDTTRKRYFIAGDDLLVLPNNGDNVVVYVPTKDEVRQILVSSIIDQVNSEVVEQARQMLRDRVAVTQGFREEAKTEAP
jgi:hypothetical protein